MKINLQCGLSSTGYGVVGTNITLALNSLKHEVALWPIGDADVSEEAVQSLRQCINRTGYYSKHAPSLRIWHQFDLAQHVGSGKHVGMPIFELDNFNPVELHHMRQQDLVLVNSQWAKDILKRFKIVSMVVPLGVDHGIFKKKDFETKPAEGPTVFLNVGKFEVRKGHDILVEAFNKAFSEKDDVKLILHCFNPCFRDQAQLKRYNEEWTQLYKSSKLGNKISVTPGRFRTQQELSSLMAQADCGVFPSRAEGWNLEAGEMLAMGKQLIISNCTAHTEYADASNSRLIEMGPLEKAYDSIWFKGQGNWASFGEAQMDQLVEHLRSVHKAKQEGALPFNLAGVNTMNNFTWKNTAEKIISFLR